MPWTHLRWSSSLGAPQPVTEEKSQSSESFTGNFPLVCPASPSRRDPAYLHLELCVSFGLHLNQEAHAIHMCVRPAQACVHLDGSSPHGFCPQWLREAVIGKEHRASSWKPRYHWSSLIPFLQLSWVSNTLDGSTHSLP